METYGVGPDIKVHRAAKRVKNAFRKARSANKNLTMKAWAKENTADEDVQIWLKTKNLV